MALSRRSFVRTVGLSGAAALVAPAIAARGREALAVGNPVTTAVAAGPIRLDSNENPHGPGPAAVEAILGAPGEASRYPDRPEEMLQEAVARAHGLPAGNVVTGCGSTEILRMAVQEFTSADRPLVTAAPTFEAPAEFASRTGAPVVAIPVDGNLRLDLDTMAARANGAGLLYVCNPNNPTGTAHDEKTIRALIEKVRAASPDTAVLIDEAYFEYVDAGGHDSAIPIATTTPRVLVSRTFSKIHGLAGLRVGWAAGASSTIAALSAWRLPSAVNLAGASAALASLEDAKNIERQKRLNREAKAFLRGFFEAADYRVIPSETNFMMVELPMPAGEFRDRCRERGVRVGRTFSPLRRFARISLGTMDEMRRAVAVFREVLAA